MPIRILIVDNQTVVRRGLTLFLRTDDDIELVGEAGNGREAVNAAFEKQPDVILMDLLMPEVDGIAATRAIRQQQPAVHIIALSSSTDYALILASFLAGVSSYLHKGSKPHQLLATIKGVVAGRVMLSPTLMDRAVSDLPVLDETVFLTPDETRLLRLLAAGHGDDEIALQLQTEVSSVRLAVKHCQAKLLSSSRLLAVVRAMQLGLIK